MTAKKDKILETAKRLKEKKQPKPAQPKVIIKLQKGGAVERFYQKYPDYDPSS